MDNGTPSPRRGLPAMQPVPVWFWAAAALLGLLFLFFLAQWWLRGTTPLLLGSLQATIFALLAVWALLMMQTHRSTIAHINANATRSDETQKQLVQLNERLHALHDFANRLCLIMTKEEVYELVTRTLVEDFGYDASQMWLVEGTTGTLRRVNHTGFDKPAVPNLFEPQDEKPPERSPYRFLYETVTSRKSLVINDVFNAMNPVTTETRQFAEKYFRSSFVITPLENEEGVFGVLTAEYHSGRPMLPGDQQTVESLSQVAYNAIAKDELRLLDEKDKMLMSSISSFVNDTLVKIELLRDMEHRIESRTAQLRETHADLLQAREMVIQSEKLSSLGRMAAGIIHEINEPLNFLVNILPELRADINALEKAKNIILEEVRDSTVRAQLQALIEEADLESHLKDMEFVFDRSIAALNKSTGIAKSLTVFTRGHDSSKRVETPLLDVARAAVEMIPRKLRGETEIVVDESPRVEWKINRNQMEQVFLNLVGNALDALGQKGRIHIRASQDSSGVRVSVCDNGPGIPPGLQSKIFEPFYTTKPAGKSTGLGLSICAEIARKFGGLLQVESEEGSGCCIHILFPKEGSMPHPL